MKVRSSVKLFTILVVSSSALAREWASDAPIAGIQNLVTAQAPRNTAIARAQLLVDEGDFEEALKVLKSGIEAPDISDNELAELFRLQGLSFLYLGDQVKAREAFEKLLQARPDAELPKNTAPKIKELYSKIKEDIKKRRVKPVKLIAENIPDVEAGNPVQVAVTIEDMALGARAKLYFRKSGQQNFSSIDLSRIKDSKTEYTGTIPDLNLSGETAFFEIEYYIEVADGAQRRLAGKGDAFSPLSFGVQPSVKASTGTASDEKKWYQSPWVWIGIGAGVAAATTAIVLVATTKETATLPVKITIEGAP
jgi:tetratricopeptide (TPR) repeat protein